MQFGLSKGGGSQIYMGKERFLPSEIPGSFEQHMKRLQKVHGKSNQLRFGSKESFLFT